MVMVGLGWKLGRAEDSRTFDFGITKSSHTPMFLGSVASLLLIYGFIDWLIDWFFFI
jgi:hypothetical protein